MMVEGVSHITFVVRDLERMADLIVGALGGVEVYSSGDDTFSISREKFFVLGGQWIAAMEGEPVKERSYNHVAFKVSEEDLSRYHVAIEKLGLEVEPGRARVEGEGQSLYFYDFDGHLFELHTGTLQERLTRYAEGRD